MMKTRAIKFDNYGGPEVLHFQENILPDPSDDEIRIGQKAIGVNFIDSYFLTGLYKTTFPSGLGTEAAGVVEAVGKNVKHLKEGDRVAYVQGPLGSYSEKRNVASKYVIKLPDDVSYIQAAAVMLKGLTVRYLFKDIHQLKRDEIFLFHAAAGGVGLIACQWAKHIGARLIGTTSSRMKAEIALSNGAWEMINYKEENIAARVIQLTHGNKVQVVYDSIGKTTWEMSLECLQNRGLMVSFGNASGPVTGVDLSQLQKGSYFVTRPTLSHYIETQEKLQMASDDLFELVSKGIINTENLKTYSLDNAILAHKDLAESKRIGGIVLTVE